MAIIIDLGHGNVVYVVRDLSKEDG